MKKGCYHWDETDEEKIGILIGLLDYLGFVCYDKSCTNFCCILNPHWRKYDKLRKRKKA
jgi:hypothetical protein